MSRFRVMLALLGVLTMVLGGAPASATDSVVLSNDRVEVRKEGEWIVWDFREPLPDASIVTFEGFKSTAGDCRYAVGRLSDGSTIPGHFRIYREIAHNATKCHLRFAVANLSLERLEEFVPTDGRQLSTTTEQPTISSKVGEVGVQSSTTSSAWFKSVWEDPIQLDVNSVQVNLTWTWNGSTVTSSSGHVVTWGWYTPTGWYRDSYSSSAARYANYAMTRGSGFFKNWAWGDDSLLTWTSHDQTTIYGYANGSIGMFAPLRKGGEDEILLHTDLVCSWTSC